MPTSSQAPNPLADPRLAEAVALHQQGRRGEALLRYNQLLSQMPGNIQARYFRGLLHLQSGEFDAGISDLTHVVKRQPEHVDAHYNLGLAYSRQGRQQKALDAFDRVLAMAPARMEARFHKGLSLASLARYEEACVCFEQAIALSPGTAVAHLNLGNALSELGRLAEALRAFEKAIALDPALAEAHNGMGVALAKLYRHEDAARHFREAIRLKPKLVEAYTGLSDALRVMGQDEAAVSCCDAALHAHPGDAVAYVVRGMSQAKLGRYGQALADFEQALVIQGDNAAAHNELGSILYCWGRQDDALVHAERAIVLVPENEAFLSGQLFNRLYNATVRADDMAAHHRLYGERFAAPLRPLWRPHANDRDPERPLRVGFVSGDFRQHPVGHFMASLLSSLQTPAFRLFAYANHRLDDALTGRIRPQFESWRNVYRLDDEALADRIRADGIDILVDLSGHTADNRLKVFARKPAPVQVTYLGYPDTTGVAAIDYILGDPRTFPPEEEGLYVERPWRLPETMLCFTPPPPNLDIEVGPLPAKENGWITFGCLNKAEKIGNDRVIDAWARILHGVPDSRLLLQNKPYGDPSVAESVRRRFAERGIGEDRLILIGKLSWEAHLSTYNRIDIALDPFPYNGTTTSVEGLWMGVPFLALKGDRLVSHMGESILHAAGMPEWIAQDLDDYVNKAIAFAGGLPSLMNTRVGLRARMLGSAICDAPRFARDLQAAFRGMWRRWCDQSDHLG